MVAPERARDTFLDVVRAIATVRVVLWHASGAAVVSYLVAAMPALFFVAGHLFDRSAARREVRDVIVDRVKRMALPLWAFSAVVWTTALAIAPGSVGVSSWSTPLRWFVPLVDPPSSGFDDGWLSSPLWFLRAMLWVLIAAGLAWRFLPRRGWGVLAFGAVGVVVVDATGRMVTDPAWWSIRWMIGDLVLYGTFFLAGVLHSRGVLVLARSRWLALAVAAAALAALWRVTQPVPLGVVNNSQPLHLFVGVAWLSLSHAARPLLEAVGRSRGGGWVAALLGRRAMTIYLWHTTAILGALAVVDAFGLRGLVASSVYGVAIAGGIVVAIAMMGWIEDITAKRSVELWPGLAPSTRQLRWAAVVVSGLSAVTVSLVPLAGGSDHDSEVATVRRPPVPSQRPPLGVFREVSETRPDPTPLTRDEAIVQLADLATSWSMQHRVPAFNVGVLTGGGFEWGLAVGHRPDVGRWAEADDELDIMSVTKLFTTSLVLRAADEGLIDLDAPVPPLDVLGDLELDPRITPLRLLRHRSGIVNYRELPTYVEDPTLVDSAVAAVRTSLALPLALEPGSGVDYSSTNFLILGLLLEQVTGEQFETMFNRSIIEQLGLSSSRHLPSEPGEPRHATAGLVTTMSDLLRGTRSLLTAADGVSPDRHRLRIEPDPYTSAAAGAWGFCPCVQDAGGNRSFFALGYTGGHTWVYHVPSLDITVAIDLYDSLWPDERYWATNDLLEQVARLASRVVG